MYSCKGTKFHSIRRGAQKKRRRQKRYGDWEGDTIEGMKSSGYTATMVDLMRKSARCLVVAPPPDKAGRPRKKKGNKQQL